MSGFGELAELQPETGLLRAAGPPSPQTLSQLRGVFGDFDGMPVVFYRDRFGLMLRVGTFVVQLDDPAVYVEWWSNGTYSYFAVSFRGARVCAVQYRSPHPSSDLGLFVRDVLANGQRRARLFLPGSM